MKCNYSNNLLSVITELFIIYGETLKVNFNQMESSILRKNNNRKRRYVMHTKTAFRTKKETWAGGFAHVRGRFKCARLFRNRRKLQTDTPGGEGGHVYKVKWNAFAYRLCGGTPKYESNTMDTVINYLY